MKKTILFFTLFAWIGFSAVAQVKETTKTNQQRPPENRSQVNKMDQDTTKYDRMSEHYLLQNGKIVYMNNGTESPFDQEKEINGVWIRPNGDVVMKDSKIVRLKENQYIDAKGRIHPLPKNFKPIDGSNKN